MRTRNTGFFPLRFTHHALHGVVRPHILDRWCYYYFRRCYRDLTGPILVGYFRQAWRTSRSKAAWSVIVLFSRIQSSGQKKKKQLLLFSHFFSARCKDSKMFLHTPNGCQLGPCRQTRTRTMLKVEHPHQEFY